MSKAIHVTATWVLVMSDDADPDLGGATEEVTSRVWAEFEEDGARDIKVHLQPMPGEFSRRITASDEAKAQIEADADQGVTLLDGLSSSKVRHPYEDGVWIFPEGHPLAGAERAAAQAHNTEVLNELQAAAPKLKELPRGNL